MRPLRSRAYALLGIAFLASLLLGMAGCNKGIQTANTRGTLTGVVDRHDAYVNADASLPDKASALADSALLRQAWQGESVAPAAVEAPLLRVADRHDGYVKGDTTLAPYKTRANLRDTEILRALLKAGKDTPATNP